MSRKGALSIPMLVLLATVVAGLCFAVVLLMQEEEPKGNVIEAVTPPVQDATLEKPTENKVDVKKIDTKPLASDSATTVTPQGARGDPTEIAGFVRDLQGQPVADATVQVVDYEYDRTSIERHLDKMKLKVLAQTATGAEGAYKFTKLTPGNKHYIRALAPNYIAQIKDVVGVGLIADFNLRPGARTEGRVIDALNGAPIVGAKVKGWYKTGNNVVDVNRLYRWEEKLITDAEGKFVFEGAPTETVLFMMWHEEYEDAKEELPVVSGKTNSFEFKMKKGLVIEGFVTNKMDGKPIPGAQVRVSNFLLPRHHVIADADGRYVVKGVERSKQMFNLSAANFSDFRETREIGDAENFDPARKNYISFAMDPTGGVAGRVLTPDGSPIDNARVFVALVNPLTAVIRGPAEAMTDTEGKFLLRNFNANANYKVAVHHDGYVIGCSDAIVVGPMEIKEGVDVRLRRGATISGTVTNEVNTPIAGVIVIAEIPPYSDVWFPPGNDLGQTSTKTMVTGADGRYELTDLWKGQFKFSLEQPDHVGLSQQLVTVKEAEQQVTQDFSMKIGRFISGTVFGVDGRPAEGATVAAMRSWSDQSEGNATVDQRGNYRIAGLVTGKYRLQAKKAGFTSRAINDVPADQTNVNFTLVETGQVTGIVVAADGGPISDFMVTLVPEEEVTSGPKPARRPGVPQSFSDPGGRFLYENVDPGTFTVAVNSPQHGRATREHIVVNGGGPVDVGAITMPRGCVFRGKITDLAGHPVNDVLVSITNSSAVQRREKSGLASVPGKEPNNGTESATKGDGGGSDKGDSGDEPFLWNARPGNDGEFLFTGLSTGTYVVKFQAKRHVVPFEDHFVLADGQDLRRDYRFPLGGQISLTIIDDFKEPVASVTLTIRDAVTGRRIDEVSTTVARSDAAGQMNLPLVPPGKFTLQIQRTGYLIREITVELTEGQVVTQTVEIEKIR